MRYIVALLVALISASVIIQAQEQNTPSPEATADITAEATPDTAQSCPRIVRTALDFTEQNCSGTSLNEACYGHIRLEAQPRLNLETFDFDDPGDIVELIELESLQLSALDTNSGQWGVMLMEVEANVEGVIRPDDVQLLLFGDTRLEDAATFARVTATADLDIRRTPSETAEAVAELPADEAIQANARTDDGDWLRVRFSAEAAGLGWIPADAITTDDDINDLSVAAAEPDEDDLSARYGPMQAFFFESAGRDAPCAEAPNSGMLIQTPEGVASVTLWLDEVVIQLDGSSFVQAQPGGNLTVNVLEGSARVESRGESRTAISGTAIDVSLDDDGLADDVPSEPRAFNAEDVQSLPVGLLDDEVTVPEAAQLNAGEPLPGAWQYQWGVNELTCDDGTTVPFTSGDEPAAIQVQQDSLTLSDLRYNEISTGVYRISYTDSFGNLHQDTLQVIAPDRIDGTKQLELVDPVCTLNVPFRLQLINES
jgi:hypothetical protein